MVFECFFFDFPVWVPACLKQGKKRPSAGQDKGKEQSRLRALFFCKLQAASRCYAQHLCGHLCEAVRGCASHFCGYCCSRNGCEWISCVEAAAAPPESSCYIPASSAAGLPVRVLRRLTWVGPSWPSSSRCVRAEEACEGTVRPTRFILSRESSRVARLRQTERAVRGRDTTR